MKSTTCNAISGMLAASLLAIAGGVPTAAADELGSLDGQPLIVTPGDPSDPQYANAGENLRNGVGSIFVEFESLPPGSGFLCTASAIDATHILTAAHCVYEPGDAVSRIRFILSAGLDAPVILEGAAYAVNPTYPAFLPFYGAFAHGDIAVIELAEPLPDGIETYELYRTADEFNKDTRHYGHGRSGRGEKGSTGGSDFFYARTGLNMYEQTLEPFFGDGIHDQLLHDFDSGGSKHNAMAWWFSSAFLCAPDNAGAPDHAQDGQCTTFKDGSFPDFKGFGKLEIGIAPGDSGGPGFIDGKIAGVHSFGFTHFCEGVTNGTDFTCGLDSSYGEMSGDTSVSFYAGWIDDVLGGGVDTTPVPQPAPAVAAAGTKMPAQALSARGKAFVNGVFSRTMRAPAELR